MATKKVDNEAKSGILKESEEISRKLIDKIACSKVEFELLKATIKNRREDELIKSGDILQKMNELFLCIEDLTNKVNKIEKPRSIIKAY